MPIDEMTLPQRALFGLALAAMGLVHLLLWRGPLGSVLSSRRLPRLIRFGPRWLAAMKGIQWLGVVLGLALFVSAITEGLLSL